MENIITLIVIIIMIVSTISKIKAKNKTKKGGKPPGSGGWMEKLNAFLANIEQNAQQQSKKSTTGISEWKKLMQGVKAVSLQTDPHEDSLDDLILEEDELPAHATEKPIVQPVKDQVRRSHKKKIPPDAPLEPALRTQKSRRSMMAINRANLRRAIIWSEILGPPVALRDQSSGRR